MNGLTHTTIISLTQNLNLNTNIPRPDNHMANLNLSCSQLQIQTTLQTMQRVVLDLDEDPIISSARKLLFLRLAAKADIDARQEFFCLLHLQQSLPFSSPSSQQETQTLSREFNTFG